MRITRIDYFKSATARLMRLSHSANRRVLPDFRTLPKGIIIMRLPTCVFATAVLWGISNVASANPINTSAVMTSPELPISVEGSFGEQPMLLAQVRRFPLRPRLRLRNRYFPRSPYTFRSPRTAPGGYYYRPLNPYTRGYYGSRGIYDWNRGRATLGPYFMWW